MNKQERKQWRSDLQPQHKGHGESWSGCPQLAAPLLGKRRSEESVTVTLTYPEMFLCQSSPLKPGRNRSCVPSASNRAFSKHPMPRQKSFFS